jgi:hypothetical protein
MDARLQHIVALIARSKIGNYTRSVASVERWNKFAFSYLEINEQERRYRSER